MDCPDPSPLDDEVLEAARLRGLLTKIANALHSDDLTEALRLTSAFRSQRD